MKKEVLIFVIVFISHVPFIWDGPGLDPDNWLSLHTGKMINETGEYRVSRFPGYPIWEFLAAICYNHYYFLSIINIVFLALICILFYKILVYLKVKEAFLGAVILSFVQGVFINSTTTMDYNMSIFFMLLFIVYSLKDKWLISGIALGLMVVSRFNNIVLIIPLLYFLKYVANSEFFFRITAIGIITFFIGFVPVFSNYGFDIFPSNVSGSFISDFESLKRSLSFSTLYVYGLLGLLGIVIATGYMILKRNLTIKLFQQNSAWVIFCFLSIGVTAIVFIKYPFESYYWLPSVPFVIILILKLIENGKVKSLILFLMLVSPFIFYISGSKISLKGSLFVEQDIENQSIKYAESIINDFVNISEEKSVLIAGNILYINEIYLRKNISSPKKLIDAISDVKVLTKLKEDGVKIYYVNGIDEYYEKEYGIRIQNYGSPFGNKLNLDR